MSSIRLEIHSLPFQHFKPASSGPRGRGHVGQPQGHPQNRHVSRHQDLGPRGRGHVGQPQGHPQNRHVSRHQDSGPRGRGRVGQPQGHPQSRHVSRHQDGRTFSDDPPSYQSVMSEYQRKSSTKTEAGANGHFANTAQGRRGHTHFRRCRGTMGHNQNQRQAPRNRHLNESQGNRSIPFEQLKQLISDTSSINISFTSMNISATGGSDSRKYTEQTGRGRGQRGRGRGQPGRGRGYPGGGRGQPGRGRGQPGRGRGQTEKGRGRGRGSC